MERNLKNKQDLGTGGEDGRRDEKAAEDRAVVELVSGANQDPTLKQVVPSADVGKMMKTGSKVIGLVVLGSHIFKDIKLWTDDKISSQEVVARIISNGVCTVASLAGSLVEDLIGGTAGVVVGIAVGVLAALGAAKLSEELMNWYFSKPKDKALKDAYKFMNLPHTASKSEIESRNRRLGRDFYPGRGTDDPEQFNKLQGAFRIIMADLERSESSSRPPGSSSTCVPQLSYS